MSGRKKKTGLRRLLRWGIGFFLVLLILSTLQVVVLRFVNPPFTAMMAWNRVTTRNAPRIDERRNLWRPLKEISPHIRQAVLAGEDQRFLSHHGFDFSEINQAVRDMVSGKANRGASTITMQVARTVFLWRDRSWFRKTAEAYYAVLIEIFWSKQRVLEIYLNTVDWGPGIVGAEAASQKYFQVSASRVSRSQAALLAAILPSPHRWSPRNPNAQVLKRQRRILKDMARMPLLS